MLDENLPAFFLKKSLNGVAHHRTIDLSHRGSDPVPAYTVQYSDPNSPSPAHKNCYAVALFDAFTPEVLYGEVLARPGWTQPTLSQEEIRKNGGIPPPPQPILPGEFVIQLYNPDQQITVELKEGKWGGSDSWLFSIPEEVFRTPSTSVLDHGQSDPASLATTPRINFVWRKESKLNKELICYMTGRSTDVKKKSSRKDPDIAIALWRQMRELTVYEPNLNRVELEDPKGMEFALLLSAIVIKDLYFSSKEQVRELFNIADEPGAKGRKLSNPKTTAAAANGALSPLVNGAPSASASGAIQPNLPLRGPSPNADRRDNLPRLQTSPQGSSSSSRPPPLADPRAQWELDAETARLKAQADAEAREIERRRREREKADELESRRLQKMVEDEEKAARLQVEQETERLRKLYGVTPIPGNQQQQQNQQQQRKPGSAPPLPPNRQRQAGPSYLHPQPLSQQQQRTPVMGSNGLYVQPSASASSVLMSGANPSSSSTGGGLGGLGPPAAAKPAKKKSFFGLRSVSDDGPGNEQRRLTKKGSSMW